MSGQSESVSPAEIVADDIVRVLSGRWTQQQKEDCFVALVLGLQLDLTQLDGSAGRILVSVLERAGITEGEQDPLGVLTRYYSEHPLPPDMIAELDNVGAILEQASQDAWKAFKAEGAAPTASPTPQGPSVAAGPLARFQLNADDD